MRPELWGARVVAAELLERNAPTTLISDNMMGTLFAQGEIGKLCFFYDSLAAAGPQGICGSLLAVQLAHVHGVPIELFSGDESQQNRLLIATCRRFSVSRFVRPASRYEPLSRKWCPGLYSKISKSYLWPKLTVK